MNTPAKRPATKTRVKRPRESYNRYEIGADTIAAAVAVLARAGADARALASKPPDVSYAAVHRRRLEHVAAGRTGFLKAVEPHVEGILQQSDLRAYKLQLARAARLVNQVTHYLNSIKPNAPSMAAIQSTLDYYGLELGEQAVERIGSAAAQRRRLGAAILREVAAAIGRDTETVAATARAIRDEDEGARGHFTDDQTAAAADLEEEHPHEVIRFALEALEAKYGATEVVTAVFAWLGARRGIVPPPR